MQQSIKQYIGDSYTQLTDELEQLVNINSFSKNVEGVNQVQDRLFHMLSDLGMKMERIPKKECGDIIIARTPRDIVGNARVLMLGHVDTVHSPDSSFQKMWIDGDRAYGPGVLDMKGGVISMIWGLKALREVSLLERLPLTVLLTPDEELGSPYSRELICEQARGSLASLVFEFGREGNQIITTRKGASIYKVRVTGRSAHSGNSYQDGANALVQLAHTISEIAKLTDLERGITLSPCIASSGKSPTTIPGEAEAIFDLRVPLERDELELRSAIESIRQEVSVVGTEVEISQVSRMPVMEQTADTHLLFESFSGFAAEAGLPSYKVNTEPLGGGSDANNTASVGTPTLDGLGPYGNGPHTDQEYIELSSLAPKILNVAAWLESGALPYLEEMERRRAQ